MIKYTLMRQFSDEIDLMIGGPGHGRLHALVLASSKRVYRVGSLRSYVSEQDSGKLCVRND